jgi:hypothetical protein
VLQACFVPSYLQLRHYWSVCVLFSTGHSVHYALCTMQVQLQLYRCTNAAHQGHHSRITDYGSLMVSSRHNSSFHVLRRPNLQARARLLLAPG